MSDARFSQPVLIAFDSLLHKCAESPLIAHFGIDCSHDLTSLLMMCVTGGYRCSIRADTKFENVSFVFQHPNFYSQYMDTSVQKVLLSFQRCLFCPVLFGTAYKSAIHYCAA
jgi:hypothetical protein